MTSWTRERECLLSNGSDELARVLVDRGHAVFVQANADEVPAHALATAR